MNKNFLSISLVFLVVLIFFSPIFNNRLPIPADTIIGLYHPFRDLYSKNYPRGIPFKNFLITDPVRQQYPWSKHAVEKIKNFELPLWNPYNFSGTPLMANMQSAVFYPLNILFFVLPFDFAWSFKVFLQPLFGGIFIFLYLKNLKTNTYASLLASIAFMFSGFNVAWLEWNTILHTGLWLPLILLSIDKIHYETESDHFIKVKIRTLNIILKFKKLYIWSIIYTFALISSFFAGHIQTFFYLYLTQLFYFLWHFYKHSKKGKLLSVYLKLNTLYIIFTFVQWIPAFQLIQLSARSVDLDWTKSGWFLPWQNLLQLIIPDFFGHPATLNYWGIWNYAEFSSYIGIFPIIMSVYAIFFRHDKKVLFFALILFLSLLFSLPTFIAKIPFIFNLPLISSSQPTRLLFLTDFSLAILAGLGLDIFMKTKNKIIYVLLLILLCFIPAVLFISFAGTNVFHIESEFINTAKRNSYLPIILFTTCSILLLLSKYLNDKLFKLLIISLIFITTLDLLRFANKFTPFSKKDYLFPQTSAITFIRQNAGFNRIMSIDSRILPPNFSLIYKLYSVDGYDPLYLRTYGEFIAASERKKPNINPPFGFNRIINPQEYDSKLIDLLGVKYILSLNELYDESNEDYIKVFQEGETRIYQNIKAFPRAFFVEKVKTVFDKQDAINALFDKDTLLSKIAIVEVNQHNEQMMNLNSLSLGKAEIISYSENEIIIRTDNNNDGFLVFTDTYYPSWQAELDGKIKLNIYKTDYNFRGVLVPKGRHLIKFYLTIFY